MTTERHPHPAPVSARPRSSAVLRMEWSNLLFLSWPADMAVLRPFLPAQLDVDPFGGRAWITLVAGCVSGARPALAPPVPGLSSFMDLGLRTYVRCGGESGVFFFSLDATSLPAVWLARAFLHLPSFRATMQIRRDGDDVRFQSRRRHQGATQGWFDCAWQARQPLSRCHPGEFPHYITERRLCLNVHRGRVRVSTLIHEHLPLREARVDSLESTMFEAAGLPRPEEPPVAFHCDRLAVALSPLREADRTGAPSSLLNPALSPRPLSFRR